MSDEISPPPTKKRLLSDALTGSKRYASSTPIILLEQQVESLQAELEHEQSLRSLDQTRAEQQQQRLEQQVKFAVQEAASAKELLDRFRERSNQLTAQLRQARDTALEQVQELQLQLEDAVDNKDNDGEEERLVKECTRLREQLQVRETQQNELEEKLTELSNVILEQQDQLNKSRTTLPDAKTEKLLEEAPPAVMKELVRVRTELAEVKRRERQLQHQVEQGENRRRTLIQENQVALRESQRLPAVQEAMEKFQTEAARCRAENDSWNEFGERLWKQLKSWNVVSAEREFPGGPPELATVIRFLDTAQEEASKAVKESQELSAKHAAAQESIEVVKAELHECKEKQSNWESEKRSLEVKVEAAERQQSLLESKEKILRREIDSLRALLKTFDDQIVPKSGEATGAERRAETETLKTSLDSVKEELKLSQTEREHLNKELEEARSSRQSLVVELDRVKAKFFKIRDALQVAKVGKEEAEARILEAENLAGKGSFNPESTRVLHLKDTPLIQALREENQVLRRQVESMKGSQADATQSGGRVVDPDKLNQRLKQSFKEQIALFREGVYLMTGYKVDMLPSGMERPTFRVRSMFAEKEDDHLMLQWPKKQGVTSLDILSTNFAKVLATTPSYEYMTKFQSLPAFLASTQLSLFEKQTVMM